MQAKRRCLLKLPPKLKVSNYPRASDIPELSPLQGKVSLALNKANGRLLATSIFSTVFAPMTAYVAFRHLGFNEIVLIVGVWIAVSLTVWVVYCGRAKQALQAHAEAFRWSPRRAFAATWMMYLSLTFFPAMVFLLIVNHWICRDLKAFGFKTPMDMIPIPHIERVASKLDAERELTRGS